MIQALTSSQIATASAALAALNSQIVFCAADPRPQNCEETSFALDCTPSHRFEMDLGRVGASRFAGSASRVYSLSPLSNDDNTLAGAPPPGGSGGGGDSDDSKDEIGADIAYYALVRLADPTCLNVGLDKVLAQSLVDHDIMERIGNEQWGSMKAKAKRLEGMEETLRRVEKTIADRKHEQAELAKSINFIPNRILSFFFEKVGSLFEKIGSLSSFFEKVGSLSSFFEKIGSLSSFFKKFREKREAKRRQYEDIDEEIRELRSYKRKFEAKLKQKGILDELLGRSAYTNKLNCYYMLTDKGLMVLKRMKEMGEHALREINFTYFMKLFEG